MNDPLWAAAVAGLGALLAAVGWILPKGRLRLFIFSFGAGVAALGTLALLQSSGHPGGLGVRLWSL